MTEKFRVILEVPVKLIGPLVELVSSEGLLVSLETIKPHKEPGRPKSMRHHAEMSGRELALSFLKEKGRATSGQIRDHFIKAGFAYNTSSPQLSSLKAAGMVKFDSPYWTLTN